MIVLASAYVVWSVVSHPTDRQLGTGRDRAVARLATSQGILYLEQVISLPQERRGLGTVSCTAWRWIWMDFHWHMSRKYKILVGFFGCCTWFMTSPRLLECVGLDQLARKWSLAKSCVWLGRHSCWFILAVLDHRIPIVWRSQVSHGVPRFAKGLGASDVGTPKKPLATKNAIGCCGGSRSATPQVTSQNVVASLFT